MTKIIAFANHKGGVGKTTSVANIGAALARKGYRTLLIDLDAQQNLTSCFLPDEQVENLEVTVYDAFSGKADLPIMNIRKSLDLVPSGIELGIAEIELSARMAREQILKELIEPIRDKYDFILLDCPPSLGVITTNALIAATDLFIPLTAEALPLRGLKMLEKVANEVKRLNKGLQLSGVFITRYNNRNLNNVILQSIGKRYGSILFHTKIRENISVAEAPLTKEDIGEYAPSSNGAKDYEALTEEIISRWKKP